MGDDETRSCKRMIPVALPRSNPWRCVVLFPFFWLFLAVEVSCKVPNSGSAAAPPGNSRESARNDAGVAVDAHGDTGKVEAASPSNGALTPGKRKPHRGLQCLLESYPEHLCSASSNTLVWCDDTEMQFDDGEPKPGLAVRLDRADLEDQLSQAYPRGVDYEIPGTDFDPGRIRHEPFFKKMYGASSQAVRTKLGTVHWMPKTGGKRLRVTTVNGVDKALAAVSRELEELPRKIRMLVAETSGTFVWRKIKGTDRLSTHSFGIAIDVAVKQSNYWRWSKPGKDGKLTYRNRIPLEVVEIFERHGFIWGGKWYHFDTMHFEYRPELLHPACLAR